MDCRNARESRPNVELKYNQNSINQRTTRMNMALLYEDPRPALRTQKRLLFEKIEVSKSYQCFDQGW